MRVVLMDIEGTTTSLAFVKAVLFPYARWRMRPFVGERPEDVRVRELVEAARAEAGGELGREATEDDALALLERWTDEDRKHPVLKELQGLVWREGYASGAFRSHVYDDVAPRMRRWRDRGRKLAIFSSGSVDAQRLLFAHAEVGDLTPLIDAYFDPTTAGAKRDAKSYAWIASALGVTPAEVLFLSDSEGELDAAAVAGMATTQLLRDGATPSMGHPHASTFADID